MTGLVKARRLLWTLLIRGESALCMRVQHGPPLQHNGGETLWKVILTPSEMDALERSIQEKGLRVVRIRQSRNEIRESQPEGVHFTASLSDFDPTQIVYRTPDCPFCFFFFPQGEEQCGVDNWPAESVVAAQKVVKAQADLVKCSLHGKGSG